MNFHPWCPSVASGVDFFREDAISVASVSDRNQDGFEEGLLQQVAMGVKHAMEQCVSEYGGLVWTIARRYARDHSTAEDIVQETFTDLWKSAHRYNQSMAAEKTFVGMVARRRAIDFARKESRQPTLEPLPDADELAKISQNGPTDLRFDREEVQDAIGRLDEETREIFSLHFDGGMTHSEIVQKTGFPLGTVKTRLRRGLIEVRNILCRPEGTQPPTPLIR